MGATTFEVCIGTTDKLWFLMEPSPNNTLQAIAEVARYFPPLNSNVLLTHEICYFFIFYTNAKVASRSQQ